MPSPLSSFFEAARTTLANVAPHDDSSGLSYRPITVPGKQGGASQHRMFAWEPSLRYRWHRGAGPGRPVLETYPRLVLYVHQQNRTNDDLTLDLIEENATVWRWFLAQHESGLAIAGIEFAKMGEEGIYDPVKQRLLFQWTVRSQEFAT